MKGIHWVILLACTVAGCEERVAVATGSEAVGASVATLPLRLGFYVSSDTPCGEASNATLLLMRRDGINGARDSCEFTSIEKTGPDRYRVAEHCSELFGAQDGNSAETVEWQILSDTSFRSESESGWERNFRYCDQASLPDDWRNNDISDLIGE